MSIWGYFWTYYKLTRYVEELESELRVLKWKHQELSEAYNEQHIELLNYEQEKFRRLV